VKGAMKPRQEILVPLFVLTIGELWVVLLVVFDVH